MIKRIHYYLIPMLLCLSPAALQAQPECEDSVEFAKNGWQSKAVQSDIDDYLRDHRMKVNWQQEPIPPDQIGRDYYEWLWSGKIGAKMKQELMQR